MDETIGNNIKDWKWVKLGDACTVVMGQSPPSTSYNTDGVGLPFFQGKAEFTDLHPIVEKWCSQPNKIAQPNDILLSVRAPVGTTNIANQECAIGRGLAAIRFKNYKYAFYFLRSIQQQLDSKGTGTTFRAISGETIRETIFPLPPEETQEEIVGKIEELFSELDKSVEELKTAQQQLKVYRQAVLKWAFEGKLTNEAVKDGELPRGWTWKLLSDVSRKITDGEHFRPITVESGVPFLSAKDVRDQGIDFSDPLFISEVTAAKAQQRCNPERGDILIVSRGATVGRMCIVNTDRTFCLLGSVILIKVQADVNSRYLTYILKSPNSNRKLITISGATAQQAIYLRDIKSLAIPVPSLQEQVEIVQEIESRLSVCDKIEETITTSLQQAEALRQSILKQAFEGRLICQ